MDIGGFKPVRNGRGELLGWTRKDPRSGITHVYNKQSETIGWAKENSASGPGYTITNRGNRVTQGSDPEYLLGIYNASKKDER